MAKSQIFPQVVHTRVDDETWEMICKCSERYKVSRAELVRRSIIKHLREIAEEERQTL